MDQTGTVRTVAGPKWPVPEWAHTVQGRSAHLATPGLSRFFPPSDYHDPSVQISPHLLLFAAEPIPNPTLQTLRPYDTNCRRRIPACLLIGADRRRGPPACPAAAADAEVGTGAGASRLLSRRRTPNAASTATAAGSTAPTASRRLHRSITVARVSSSTRRPRPPPCLRRPSLPLYTIPVNPTPNTAAAAGEDNHAAGRSTNHGADLKVLL